MLFANASIHSLIVNKRTDEASEAALPGYSVVHRLLVGHRLPELPQGLPQEPLQEQAQTLAQTPRSLGSTGLSICVYYAVCAFARTGRGIRVSPLQGNG